MTTLEPVEGDIVFFDWNGDGRYDHTGIFVMWLEKGKTFHSVEGNTAIGNDSNGGGVMLRKRTNHNVLFVKVKKVKRGFYEATFVPITDNPKAIPDFEITNVFLREVEKQILEAPEYYFWTHKRWKHKR